MALSRVTKLFAVKDAKVSKLTSDPDGGSTVYATAVDVPGIRSCSISGDMETKELRGDQVVLDSDTVLNNITVDFEYAKLSLDCLKVWIGGNVADGGSGSVETVTYSLLGTDTLFPTWKFEAQVVSTDNPGGDFHMVLYRCKLADFPEVGTNLDDYETFTVSGSASPRLSDDKWIDLVINETETAISA